MVTPVPVVESPKSHEYVAIVPSGSLLAEASNDTVWPATGLEGVKVNEATGGRSLMVTVPVADPVNPPSSVAVTVIV